jgi:hypothetical protein
MKIIVFDGLDNAGKTWTMNKLENLMYTKNLNFVVTHYPSKRLCESELFKELPKLENKNNITLKMKFINCLLAEEKSDLLFYKNNNIDYVLVDRMMISSLIYQGNIEYPFDMENFIITEYRKMLSDIIDIENDFYNFIFIPKIKNDESETNESKLKFDAMYDHLKIKLEKLLECQPLIKSNEDLFKNSFVFNEKEFMTESKPYTRCFLNKIDDARLNFIQQKLNF